MVEERRLSLRGNTVKIPTQVQDLCGDQRHHRGFFRVLPIEAAYMAREHSVGKAEGSSPSIITGVCTVPAIHAEGDPSIMA
jgi:hypothetical protein